GDPGEPGVPIVLGKSATHLQWRYLDSEIRTDLVALNEIQGPPGPPGESGSSSGARMVGFFGFYPPLRWQTEPGNAELGGGDAPHHWMADTGSASHVRLATTSYDADPDVVLALEYSTDGINWMGGLDDELYVYLDASKTPKASEWIPLQDEARYF